MPARSLHVELLASTPSQQELIAAAARLCYSKSDISSLMEKVSAQDQGTFLQKIIESGHLSVLEHASFTFGIEGVSRVLLAQLTRHRLASFSVQSQRYVSYAEAFNYIIPPSIRELGEEAVAQYEQQMSQMHAWYRGWQERLGKGEGGNEDARFVLPGACETRLVLTMNVRELLHFFELRCCSRAQWEIRELAITMLRLCKQQAPTLFEKSGPGCLRGACPEGIKTCGKQQAIRLKFTDL
ncbi:MAG: FAD-dependent thymidylate synthase [Christensenellales bacterium]